MFVVIPAVVLVLAGLYFWLIGHWFGRVVAFLLFAVSFGVIADLAAHSPIAGLFGIILAWPVSGIPMYIHRHKARTADQSLALSFR